VSRRPRLRRRIREADLPPAIARTFRENLDVFVVNDDEVSPMRQAVVDRLLLVPERVPLAPFDALYPHAELFLSACLTVAVADGTYSVEDARRVSAYAHRLGLSARQLASLEHRVFAELRERGQTKMARDRETSDPDPYSDAETTEVDRSRQSQPSAGAASLATPPST